MTSYTKPATQAERFHEQRLRANRFPYQAKPPVMPSRTNGHKKTWGMKKK